MSGKEGQSETIFSSTGRLGPSRRPGNRLYVNGSRYSNEPPVFSTNLERLVSTEKKHPQITRAVFKGVVSNDVLSSVLAEDGRQKDLEVVVPLVDYGMPNSSLVYFGRNNENRSPIVPVGAMMEGTSEQTELIDKPPLERIEAAVSKGFAFTDIIKEDQINQLYALWGSTFGWEPEQIETFRQRLINDAQGIPAERKVWFSGIEHKGKLIGVAMAERIKLPGENGDLDCIESTEWRIVREYEKNGLAPAVVAMLNAQVLTSLGDIPAPFIFAECNIESFAHTAGHKAGLQIPSRGENGSQVPQILVQNVSIGDDVKTEQDYRDFAFMYLTPESISKYYNSEARGKMMQHLN